MSTNKHLGLIAVVLMLAALVFVTVLCFRPGLLGIRAAANTVGYEKYFNENKIMSVDIIANDESWQKMLDNAESETYIKCDVRINGERIDNVGIRPKGNSSLQQVSSSGSDRYSLKIEFDHYVKDQTFHGLDKLVLNNNVADATEMKEFISYEIFESVGVAVPLHSYAQLKVNGVKKGLYLAIESMEESYAYRIYGPEYGKLYKPESINMGGAFGAQEAANEFVKFQESRKDDTSDSTSTDADQSGSSGVIQKSDSFNENRAGHFDGRGLEAGGGGAGTDLVYTDDKISSYSGIFDTAAFKTTRKDNKRVIKALQNLNSGTDLERYINVKATLRYFAAQTFIINFDSYYGSLQHNYYLYEKDGQLTMLPWDLNLSFAGYESGSASSAINYPIDTPVSGVSMVKRPMLNKLLEVPAYKELYHKYLKEIVKDYIDSGKFAEKIEATNQLIKPYVEEDSTAFYTAEQYEEAVPVLKKFGVLRAESIAGQLDGTIPSTKDGQEKDSSKLVDTGNLDITVLGSQGRGNQAGKREFMNGNDSSSYENNFSNGGKPAMPGKSGKGNAGKLPSAGGNSGFGAAGQMPAGPGGNGDNGNAANASAAKNNSSDNSKSAGKFTKGELLDFGILGGISVLGLLSVYLLKRRKYSI